MQRFFENKEQFSEVKTIKLEFNPTYEKLLKENNLSKLCDFFLAPTTNSFRAVSERLTVGLDLQNGDKMVRVYLKRHWSETKSHSTQPHIEALSEWENLSHLSKDGIPVPEPLAFGCGFIDGHSVGFVILKEVAGVQGDHFLRDNWKMMNVKRKNDLLQKWAKLAADFHRLGYNHRDFYLCHFFVHDDRENFILHLIDLQRVQKRRFFRQRWIVKDLAQMAYSSLSLVSKTFRLRFFLKFLGKEKLTIKDKRFIGKIEKKVSLMLAREKEGKIR